MKNFVILISLFIINKSLFSQNLTVDQVNSDAAARAFVMQENYDKNNAPQWAHFYFTDGKEWESYYNLSKNESDNVQQKMQPLRWQKADINHDGKQDLIISGYIARRPKDWTTATFKLLVFMSDARKNYTQLNLINDQLDKFPTYFNIVTLGNNNGYLQIFRWHLQPENSHDIPLTSDTLNYNNFLGYFVKLTNYYYPQSVQRVDYTVQENHNGSYHSLSIENINGKLPMNVSLFRQPNKTPLDFKARASQKLWQNIDTLLRNVHVTGDSVVYNDDNSYDKLPITLTILYADGTKKIIKDYDADRSFTLMTIYQVFEDIVNGTLDLYAQRQEQMQQINDDWD